MSTDTVITYIGLLEKVFVVYRMPGFSKNLRKEITKNKKTYFYDVGVRNVIIEDFGVEIKWGNKIVKAPKSWLENYEEASFRTVNSTNYQDFIL